MQLTNSDANVYGSPRPGLRWLQQQQASRGKGVSIGDESSAVEVQDGQAGMWVTRGGICGAEGTDIYAD